MLRARKRIESPSLRQQIRVLRQDEQRLLRQVAGDPRHLHRFEQAVYSQNGEDGIVAEIFRRIGSGQCSFVEIGASDGTENCTRALVENGWRGVWVEGDPDKARAARTLIGERPVVVKEAFVSCESILGDLTASLPAEHLDLLVIDIDGNDYWLWKTVSSQYHARVVVIEYNAVHGPRDHWVMPYDADHRWQETSWHGASLKALASLGANLGYTLVGCDSQGVNAFFVTSEEAGRFTARSAEDHYVPPRFRLPFGHPASAWEPFHGRPLDDAERQAVRIQAEPERSMTASPSERVYLEVTVDNGTEVAIGESEANPVRVAGWWLDSAGQRLPGEPERSIQSWQAGPKATAHLLARVQAPQRPGEYSLMLGLVQEGISWFDPPTGVASAGRWTIG